MRWRYRWILILLVPSLCWADKIIMKDGRVFQGRIMGETSRSMLISSPGHPHPRFLATDDIMTVVRDSHYEPVVKESQRYAMAELAVGPAVFISRELDLAPAAALQFAGGLRPCRWVELDGELDGFAHASGGLSVTDGTTLRSYEKFRMVDGGFSVRAFPLAARMKTTEPYLLLGYAWSRLSPQATDDALKGSTLKFGVGAQRLWRGNWVADARLLYHRTRYDSVNFQSNSGDLVSTIKNDHLVIYAGLSYHWL